MKHDPKTMKLNQLTTSEDDFKHINVREVTKDGRFYRRVLTPDMDVSGECQEIKDIAEREWTDEVKAAYKQWDYDETIRVYGRWIDWMQKLQMNMLVIVKQSIQIGVSSLKRFTMTD